MRHKPRRREEPYRVNNRIEAKEVRVVGEGIQPGVYPLLTALKIAEEAGRDLVEISPKAVPPVCKVIDYSKFKYEQKKKKKDFKAKAQKVIVKELRITPNTGIHDLAFKTKHAIKFLSEGANVESYVQFKGRQIFSPVIRKEGEEKLMELSAKLSDYGKPDGNIRRRGRRSFLTIKPHQKNR
ncbi:MAG: translation initiation factor IF-3 [Bacteroidota bacterium]